MRALVYPLDGPVRLNFKHYGGPSSWLSRLSVIRASIPGLTRTTVHITIIV